MNYNHLYYFYMVVREGSISAASRHLNVSQPSLSSQIKTFEQNFGISLFDRRGNKLELTPKGKSVYSKAAQMFEISESFKGLKDGETSPLPLKIGIADEIERPFTVNLFKTLFKKWKRKDPPFISFSTGMTDELMSKLRSWSVDAVITNRPSSYDDLEIAGTLVMPVYFAVAAQSSALQKNAVLCHAREIPRLLDSLGKGLAVPAARLKLREEIDDFLSKCKRSQQVVFESDTLAMIARAVIDNVGVGFLPLPYVFRDFLKKDITVFGPTEGLWRHILFLMVKKGRTEASGVTEISEAFDDLRKEVARILETIQFGASVDHFFELGKSK